MKVTKEGTTNIIRWYQPECGADCESIDCRRCVYNQYAAMDARCPFKQYLIDHPAEKPTDTDKLSNALQDQRSAQDILNMCATLQANTMQAQVEPLQDMVNVLDLIIEVTEKQDKLTKIQQGQPVPEHQEDKHHTLKMVYVKEKPIKKDQAGNLWNLSYVMTESGDIYAKEFYHHCPLAHNNLIRLIYIKEDRVHACPVCKQVFK